MVHLSVDCNAEKKHYKFDLDVLIFQDDGSYIAYCPALDMTEASDTFNSVIGDFYEHFQLYAEFCIEHNTLLDDLKAHGWSVGDGVICPPIFSSLISNPEVRHILDNPINFDRIILPASLYIAV